jgi:hypothetical protein
MYYYKRMVKKQYGTKKNTKKSSKRHNNTRKRYRGGRGYTTGASATLAQLAPASISGFIGSGISWLNNIKY